MSISITSCKKKEIFDDDIKENYIDKLPDNSEDGLTLHCFNWTYKQIKDNLNLIADSGFKNILTMPIQQPKNNGSAWWDFYQPLSLSIAENSLLGSKQELIELCQEAEKYNISILIDAVVNHMANISEEEKEDDGSPKVNPDVEEYEALIYRNRNKDVDGIGITFHHNVQANGSGSETQVYSWGNLPDLNTSNPYIQERVLSFLKECIDIGVDGFRFDAAKHIETQKDAEYASDFWNNTLLLSKDYYKTKTGKDLYVYGEMLGYPSGRNLDVYTDVMLITDDLYVQQLENSFIQKDPKLILNAKLKVDDPKKLIVWVESHDEYISGNSHYNDSQIFKYWSIIAAKKDLGGLFLARPDENITVGKISSFSFMDRQLICVNRFHNRFYDADSFESAYESYYINEKIKDNDEAALIINTSDIKNEEVIVELKHIKDGDYYDSLTNDKVIVKNHKAHIKFNDSGISIITQSKPKSTSEKFKVLNLNPEYLNDRYELYMWSWPDNSWSKNYEIVDGMLLVDVEGMDGFLFAIFEKGYEIKDLNNWDDKAIKQSLDITGDILKKGYVDMKDF